jgi:hypothetical protein
VWTEKCGTESTVNGHRGILVLIHVLSQDVVFSTDYTGRRDTICLIPWSRVSPEKLTVSHLFKKNSPRFMKRKVSLPHSQASATRTYSETDQSSPGPPPYLLKILFNIIHQPTCCSSKWSLSLRSPHQTPLGTSPVSHTCYISHPSHSS